MCHICIKKTKQCYSKLARKKLICTETGCGAVCKVCSDLWHSVVRTLHPKFSVLWLVFSALHDRLVEQFTVSCIPVIPWIRIIIGLSHVIWIIIIIWISIICITSLLPWIFISIRHVLAIVSSEVIEILVVIVPVVRIELLVATFADTRWLRLRNS